MLPKMTSPKLTPTAHVESLEAALFPIGVQAQETFLHEQGGFDGEGNVLRGPLAFNVAPDRQDGVADEFVDRAAPGEDVVDHEREVFVQLGDKLGRIHLFGHGGKPAQIGHDQRDAFALTAQLAEIGLRIIEHFADDVFRDVGFERAADAEFFERLVREIVNKGDEAGDGEGQGRRDREHDGVGMVVREFDREEITPPPKGRRRRGATMFS